MQFYRQFILTIVVAAAVASSASARDVFVNNMTGDNAADGYRAAAEFDSGPVRTIAKALRIVHPGDRIVLANTGAPYHEMISVGDVNHRGYADLPLVIDGGGATLDGTVATDPDAWRYENDNIFSFRPRRLTYQQLFRDGRPLRHARADMRSLGTVMLVPLEWTLLADRIALRVETDQLPRNYELRHAGRQTGITLYNTEFVRIENLIVQGFQQDGINAHELVRHCELVRVECRANGRSGISVGGVSRVAIRESNCYDNGRAQLRVEGLAHVTADGCDFQRDDTHAPWLEIRGGQVFVDGRPIEL